MEGNPKQNANLSRDFLELLNQNPNRLLAALLINELAKRGITKYYISPGHRNAPLMAAIHHHPLAEMESIIDERSAGYRALGYAASSQKCPVLVCTSGTALANYHPALIEAWASDLPLLVLSADRTQQQVLAGENQTIVQMGIYGRFAPSLELNSPSSLPRQLDDFLDPKRPRHINIPFGEPLGGESIPIETQTSQSAHTLLDLPYSKPQEAPMESAKIMEIMDRAQSPLVVLGEIKSLSERQSLLPWLKKTSLPIYPDITSGLKYQFNLNDGIIPGFEHPEVSEYLSGQIDTILHIGGRVTSRSYYRFLQDNQQINVLNVSSSSHLRDPAMRTHLFFRASPAHCFPLSPQKTSLKEWDMSWAEEKIHKVSQAPLSFPQISKILIENIPEGIPLFLGNSTTIRSFDNFLSFELNKNIPLYYNRGVSGIEGHIATAQGVAEGTGQMTTVVLGDISFIHDMASLMSFPTGHPGLIIVLINDGGGGIFNLLPTSKEKEILPYMTTPHSMRFEAITKQFGIPYRTAASGEELIRSYQFLLERGCGLLEVTLDPQSNLEIYRQLKTLKGSHVVP